MILISQWYEPKNTARAEELSKVRLGNESSNIFSDCEYVSGLDRRWTYGDFFSLAAEKYPGQVCVLANTDIAFDRTAGIIREACSEGRLISLTRWESPVSPRMLGHNVDERFYSGTQDVWCFVGGDLVGIGNSIPLGVVGCDNALIGEAALAGVEVFNPAIDIRTYHRHEFRDESPSECVYGTYGYPELTTLSSNGLCMLHDWSPGTTEIEARIVSTCRQ